MTSPFTENFFKFPYTTYKFPGQASDENILYITREANVMLWLRLLGVVVVSLILFVVGLMGSWYASLVSQEISVLILSLCFITGLFFLGMGYWWISQLWQKSIFILTTQRLTKFIYTTPWNRYSLSLSLDKVVDTGAYGRGYFQALFGLGTFTARSSAGNRAEKYFYIENVYYFEDLASYVNKLLNAYQRQHERIASFRPFIPQLKGQARKDFMKQYPDYWS